jgi:hypothetical protein
MNDDLKDKLIKTALGLYGVAAGGELTGEPVVAGAVGIGGVVLGIVVQVGRAAAKYFVDQSATQAKVLETLNSVQLELKEQSIVLTHLAYRMGHPVTPIRRDQPTAPPPIVSPHMEHGGAA